MLKMSRLTFALTSLALAAAIVVPVAAEDGQKLSITGVNYTKWLWGTQRIAGGLSVRRLAQVGLDHVDPVIPYRLRG